jgi:hypothetical protein
MAGSRLKPYKTVKRFRRGRARRGQALVVSNRRVTVEESRILGCRRDVSPRSETCLRAAAESDPSRGRPELVRLTDSNGG